MIHFFINELYSFGQFTPFQMLEAIEQDTCPVELFGCDKHVPFNADKHTCCNCEHELYNHCPYAFKRGKYHIIRQCLNSESEKLKNMAILLRCLVVSAISFYDTYTERELSILQDLKDKAFCIYFNTN